MFAIIIRFDELRLHFFKSVYLDGWDAAVGASFDAEISYVQDALHGLSLYAAKPFEESEEALEFTEAMSSGVLRTTMAGTAILPPFHKIHPDLSGEQDSQFCSQEAFSAMVNALVVGTRPDSDGDERFAISQHT